LFQEQAIRASHPQWAAWLWIRYAELLVGYLFFVLASSRVPRLLPGDHLEEDKPSSFGLLRASAVTLAEQLRLDSTAGPWARFVGTVLGEDARGQRRLERINQDRNNIAHGRRFRSPGEVRDDITAFLQLDRWKALQQEHPPPKAEDLRPWLQPHPESNHQAETGVLERWSRRGWDYVVPHTGSRFRLNRCGIT
jgi:hypothetical protein